jgi:hypothetical protein
VTSNRVPGGVALAPDEATLIDDRFMYSTVVFYLHTELALTNRRFLAARPSTIFGLIPVGTARSSYPIDNIAGVNAGTRFDVLGDLSSMMNWMPWRARRVGCRPSCPPLVYSPTCRA